MTLYGKASASAQYTMGQEAVPVGNETVLSKSLCNTCPELFQQLLSVYGLLRHCQAQNDFLSTWLC